jgi:hypothetical protein
MRRGMVTICVIALMAATCGFARCDSAQNQGVWGPLADMAGHDWVAVHAGAPTTIVKFRWKRPGRLLTATGANSSGNTFKVEYELQPAGRITELNQRNGKLYRSEYKRTPNGFVEQGEQDGRQVRRVYRQVSETTFVSRNETFMDGAWKITRNDGTFVMASPAWLAQLGWWPANQTPKR